MKEKDLDWAKVVEQSQPSTNDRKNEKNTILEALISNREQDIKEEPIHKITYTRQYGTRSKERHKDRNCRYCDAPHWNHNHKTPARHLISQKCKKGHFTNACGFEQQKRQEIKELMEILKTKESYTDRSINIVTKIEHLTDRINYITMTIRIGGTKKEFIVNTGSPITITTPDKEIFKGKKYYQ